ncbi:MAG: efflux RND transporter periplasmic adaptor subunit [Vicinamibacterales bacterium]|jgi:HlyD family secretion protein|nr:efflux RND transporter periplasmic adaptor subunit [Vicinamibacterales bacterium]
MKKALLVLVIIGAGITAYGYLGYRTTEFIPEVSTVTLNRGDVVDTVGATGALEAVTTVQVGSQVSGIIEELNADYNSIVREGDVIARLEPSLFETQIEQARANLARSEADVERLAVTLEDANTQLARSEDLAARELISATELEAAQVAVRSAEAQLKSAQASVIQSAASLNQNEVNLGHTVITAPIDGIVIARQVDAGQTVAAGMSAPELFIIAADLTKMQVIANIDESDVGRIRPGQPVTFTVDAYATEEFTGTVSQIRLEPVVLQNVVTYATVIDVPNNELKLKPGMTATVTLEIARRENILRVPNAALRFNPTPDMFAALNQPVPQILQRPGGGGGDRAQGPGGSRRGGRGGGFGGDMSDADRQAMRERMQNMTPEQRAEFFAARGGGRGGGGAGFGGRGGGGGARRRASQSADSAVPTVDRGATTIDALFAPLEINETDATVWVLDGDQLRPVDVRLGVTDGTGTELLSVRGGAPPRRQAPDPEIADLRQQIEALEEGPARENLAQLLARLEATADQAVPEAPQATMASTLTAGDQLVTGVTTPDNGSTGGASRGGGSPLMPQFGRGRRPGGGRR